MSDNLKESPLARRTGFHSLRRFFSIKVRHTPSGRQLSADWMRLTLAVAAVGVGGWLASASAAYAFVRYQRGVSTAELVDFILLPIRWKHYQQTRGEFHIATAQRQTGERAFREAFHNLRIGVAKAPNHRDGRLLLADFYVAWKRPDLALATLEAGIPIHRTDPVFLRALFTYLLQQQRDDQLLEIAQSLVKNDLGSAETRQLVRLAAASAALHRGRFDLAESWLQDGSISDAHEAQLLQAKIDWECGYPELALHRLRSLRTTHPEHAETYAQLVSYLRQSGREAEARQESLIRQLANPDDPRARIDLVHAWHRAGDTARRDREATTLLLDFAQNSDALLALAEFAANAGLPKLADDVYQHCRKANIGWEAPALMMVEACVVAEHYQAALDRAKQLLDDNPDWGDRHAPVLNGLQAIALRGLGDTEASALYLANFLAQKNVRADNLVAVSQRLLRIHARDQARQVLARAVTTDPANQPALTLLLKIDLESGNTTAVIAHLDRFLAMRRPSTEILRSAFHQLGSDRHLFIPDRDPILRRLKTALDATSPTAPHKT